MLGDNIRKIRKSKHISINNLSKMSGVSLGYLSDLENNKLINPTLDKLGKIAESLEVPTKDLLSEDELDNTVSALGNVQKLLNECDDKFHIDNSIYTIFSKFDNEHFTKEEQKEIINFINYVISKRK